MGGRLRRDLLLGVDEEGRISKVDARNGADAGSPWIAMVPMRAPQALKRLDTESTMITRVNIGNFF